MTGRFQTGHVAEDKAGAFKQLRSQAELGNEGKKAELGNEGKKTDYF